MVRDHRCLFSDRDSVVREITGCNTRAVERRSGGVVGGQNIHLCIPFGLYPAPRLCSACYLHAAADESPLWGTSDGVSDQLPVLYRAVGGAFFRAVCLWTCKKRGSGSCGRYSRIFGDAGCGNGQDETGFCLEEYNPLLKRIMRVRSV